MLLSKISGRSLKGGDFDLDLAQANVLHGDNFAGKTRVTDAVRLLLVGHLPELGLLPRATFGLASGPSMEVSGVLVDGSVEYHLRRRWFLKGDVVKMESDIPPALEDVPLLTVMLNADAYFGLTDRQRVDYVFANIPGGKMPTREQIIARIAKAAPEYEFEPFYQDIDAIEDDDEKKPKNLQQELEILIEYVADEWKSLKEHAKRMENTVKGITNLRALDTPLRSENEVKDERARLERTIAELNEKKGVLIGSFTRMKSDRERRVVIVRELEHGMKTRLELVGLKDKLELLDAEIAKFIPVKDETLRAATNVCFGQMTAIETLKRARASAEDIRAAREKELAALEGASSCPCCGAAGDGWKKTKSLQLEDDIAAAKKLSIQTVELITSAEKDLLESTRKKDSLAKELEAQRMINENRRRVAADIARLEPSIARLEAMKEEAGRLLPDDPDLTAKVETLQTELNIKTQEVRALERELEEITSRSQDKIRLAEAETARDKAKKDQDLAAAAGKELREIQRELVEEAFRPLLETANAIFGAVLVSPLGYRDGEIGTWRGGNWVGHKTFSGTEKALAYASIQAALAAKSPARIVIVDELGRLTFATAALAAMAIAVAIDKGLVDQFIGIDPERSALYSNLFGPAKFSPFKVQKIG